MHYRGNYSSPRHLPFVETVTDLDIACEIGHYQVLGTPVTLNEPAAAPMRAFRKFGTILSPIQRMR